MRIGVCPARNVDACAIESNDSVLCRSETTTLKGDAVAAVMRDINVVEVTGHEPRARRGPDSLAIIVDAGVRNVHISTRSGQSDIDAGSATRQEAEDLAVLDVQRLAPDEPNPDEATGSAVNRNMPKRYHDGIRRRCKAIVDGNAVRAGGQNAGHAASIDGD